MHLLIFLLFLTVNGGHFWLLTFKKKGATEYVLLRGGVSRVGAGRVVDGVGREGHASFGVVHEVGARGSTLRAHVGGREPSEGDAGQAVVRRGRDAAHLVGGALLVTVAAAGVRHNALE